MEENTYDFDPEELAKTVEHLLNKIKDGYSKAQYDEFMRDGDTQDILHLLELCSGEIHEENLYNEFKKLIEIRKKRRKAKDFRMLAQHLIDLLDKYPDLMKDLQNAIKDIQRTKIALANRKYGTKTMNQLQHAFEIAEMKKKERQIEVAR